MNQLNSFTSFLLKNTSQIQTLYTDLATVSAQLSDDRTALASAFSNLATATKELDVLATNNRANLKGSVSELVDITNTLVQDKSSLEEVLDDTPLALQNLSGSFDPNTQTLDVRTNLPTSDNDGLALLLCNALNTTSVVNQLPAGVKNAACGAATTVAGAATGSSTPRRTRSPRSPARCLLSERAPSEPGDQGRRTDRLPCACRHGL